MATATRSVKVKFDGSAVGLERAAKRGGRAMDGFQRQAKRSMGGLKNLFGGFADGLVGLPKLVGNAFSAIPSEAKLAIVAAGAAAGVAFAAAGAAAIVAGFQLAFGGGVLALGISRAVKHPAVQAAWAPLGAQVQAALDRLGTHFVDPLAHAAGAFKPLVDSLSGMADRLGATFAPVIDKLAPAFAEMGQKILPAVVGVAIASLPMFTTLAQKAPVIADAIVRFLGVIERNGPAANQFFGRMLDGVVRLLDFFGFLIDKLAQVYSWLERIAAKFDRSRLSFGDGNVEFGRIPGRAGGGDVAPFSSYMVGEKEPEILTMGSRGGHITPLSKVGSAAGKTNFEVHVHVDDPTLRDLVRVEIRQQNRGTMRAVTAMSGAR